MADDMATSLNDLPGGPPLNGDSFQREPSRGNQQITHSVMSELEARRNAESANFQGNPPPAGQILNDPRGDPYAGNEHYQHHTQVQETKKGLYELLTSILLADLKEPILVAVICFLVHQEFFSNIILGFLPYSLKFLASPGSSSMIPSVVKALLVAVAFFFLRTMV